MRSEEIYLYRPYLFTIAYDMLGEVEAAEDVVQDTFIKWLQTDTSHVYQVKAYLTRMVINTSIDKLNLLKKERELYKGLWMPEPILTDEKQQDEHTVEYALLFLLERLNPVERAVFVLKEVLAVAYHEIAAMLDLTEDNCRQLFHRAKEKVRAPKKKQEADIKKHAELTEAFLQAVYVNDYKKLQDIFLNDIVMYQDGGGKMAAALKPLHGIDKVIKFLHGVMGLEPDAQFRIEPVHINSSLGILIYRNNQLDTVFTLEVENDKISELFFLRNPDKINRKNIF